MKSFKQQEGKYESIAVFGMYFALLTYYHRDKVQGNIHSLLFEGKESIL